MTEYSVIIEFAKLLLGFYDQTFPHRPLARPAVINDDARPLEQVPLHTIEPYINTFISAESEVPYEWLVGQYTAENIQNIFKYVIDNTPTANEALNIGIEYNDLLSNILSTTFEQRKNGTIWGRLYIKGSTAPAKLFVFEAIISHVINRFLSRYLSGLAINNVNLRSSSFGELVEIISKFLTERGYPIGMSYTPGEYAIWSSPKKLLKFEGGNSDEKLKIILIKELQEKLSKTPDYESWLSKVMFYARCNVQKGIKLEDACQHFNVSRRTMSRHLENEGTSFSMILDEIRKEKAMALIKNKSLPLKQIAHSVGFNCVSSLSNAFKAWTGMTPSAYRKIL